MAKTRANNEGNIKLRSDGRYEVRVTVDYDKTTGQPKRISKYAKTKEEAVKLLNQMSFMNDTSPNTFTRVTLGDWLDLCLEVYIKNTIKQSTYLSYESYIRVHLKPAWPLGEFCVSDLSTAEFTENAFETISSLHRYLPDYFVRFSSFIEKNIDLLREVLNRGMRTALSLADEWEISDDGCTSLGIFYGVAELVSEYHNSLRPQPDIAVRMNHVLGENWDDFLRQVFQNNADCRGNYSDLATIFMAVASENLLRGNFEKRSRDGKPLNVYESTGSDGVVYMDDQFCYFTRKAFSSVCKACDASGPMVIHALRDANLLHGQSVNASTVMTRITTYDVYGCVRTERVYKIRREDIAEANVNIDCYQGGLR